jgi:hypothetical protein
MPVLGERGLAEHGGVSCSETSSVCDIESLREALSERGKDRNLLIAAAHRAIVDSFPR